VGEAEIKSLAVAEAVRKDVQDLVRGYRNLAEGIESLYADERRRRIVLATHMHAGDGNVHVNIPVLSNDRAMMRRAGRRSTG
jgi:D-lactate dehydrogenase (cytochrome)